MESALYTPFGSKCFDITTIYGTSVSVGAGTADAGCLRVVIASNNNAPVQLVAGTAYAGKFRPTDGTNDITMSTAPGDASTNTVTTLPSLAYNLGFNGSTWDRLQVDGSKYLKVVLPSALPAGTAYIGKTRVTDGTNDLSLSTAPADAASNTVTTIPTTAYLTGFNGTTWDRLQVDGSKFLKTVISSSIAAGTNYIGKVRQTDGTNDLTLSTAPGDAASNTVTSVPSLCYNLGYNGTTWDRLQVDASKYLKTVVSAALPAGANSIGTVVLGAGTAYAGKVRVTDGTNDTTLSTAGADGSSNTVNTLPSSAYMLGYNGSTWDRCRVDASKNLNVNVNTAIAAGTNTIGAVNIKPATSGGLTPFKSLDINTTALAVKASAGQVFGWAIYNNNAAVRYLKFWNTAQGSVTVGTTATLFAIGIPGGALSNVSYDNGIAFGTAITIAGTTGLADNNSGAPTAGDLSGAIFYA